MELLKNIINKIINKFGWTLIKKRKPRAPNPYGKIDYNNLKCMNDCKGILHLGAHRGSEAEVYNWFGKNVVWVEAFPTIFRSLEENLMFYKNQIPLLALLSDTDGEDVDFYISNHDAACSSMYNFTNEIYNNEVWSRESGKYEMLRKIKLKTMKLDTLLENNNIDAKNFDHWIIDLQGAELKALKGGVNSIKYCKSMHVEVSKKKFYEHSVLWPELKDWLIKRGFYPTKEPELDEEDILFIRK